MTGFSILDSLSCALELVSLDTKVCKVVLGDTLCRDIPKNSKDFVLVSDDFASPQRWCLVESDEKGQIKQLFDKQSNIEIENKKVLVGYYQFTNIPLLQKLLSEIIYAQKTQLSDLLAQYNRQQAIYCFETKAWFDFGHKAGLIKAQNYFYNSRDFNSLKSNPILGTITKASANCQKLEDEYFWYNDLPEGLKILAPRTFGFKKKDTVAELEMEMYGYPALSELLILGHLSVEEWQLIIRRLFEVHKMCEKYEGQLSESNFYNLYITKTQKRLEMLKKQGTFWEALLAYDTIKINGVEYKNINFFEEKLKAKLEELVKTVKVSVMHGDYCFSNILFDTNSFICRLIDPRGRLEERTIYGDARYDIAKLRHSVVGGYDFAVHGLFKLTQEGNSFEVSNNYPDFQEELTAFFDKATVEFGYDLSQIKLIEAILFLSMIPLHKDNLDRQKIFYLKAVKKMNDVFKETK
ncbi:MAG: hypothetical protein PHI50_00200 [Alphaproteobacteria bacterium]|nr:hypothetical protein [Alphaproteobacteria bacterium]